MAEAICLRCGSHKRTPWKTCTRCGCNPTTDPETLLKSVYLSTGRIEDETLIAGYRAKLDEIGVAIEAGEAIQFEPNELARLEQQRKDVEAIPWFAPWLAVGRFFIRLLAVGAVLGILLSVARRLI